ncbi:MAG TPA: glycosyltransferase, partial [Acetobacteraceae bacterium]|nr:glycosyltransferase [Acetobacteraceae bacterium]
RRRPPVDVVVAVHGGAARTLACLDSVLADIRRPSRLIVVDDASPEPELTTALAALAGRGRITLLRHRRNRGFTTSANAGMRAAAGHDVVLLNSDTLVAPGWLKELRAVAYGAPDIGTVTPLSNDATILSYPDPAGGNPVPDCAATQRIDRLARRANGGGAIDIPVGVGFCLYIRRACLDTVGPLRADLFAQGYGEENDFCLRARRLGWRHVAATGAFVAHVGGHSFGHTAQHLRRRNEALLERLHPGFADLVRAHAHADPLAESRRRLDLARWHAERRRGSRAVLLVTHASGGGVERQVAVSAAKYRTRGDRVIVLRPSRSSDGTRCVSIGEGTDGGFPNLRYRMPDELAALRRLLVGERPWLIELHHTVGHHPAVLELIGHLDAPYDVHVHDYAWLCGRIALVGPSERYCGEPAVARCEACVAEAGNLIDDDISVAALRGRSAAVLSAARRVIVPSHDTADRLRRYFPGIRPVVEHHEDDGGSPDPAAYSAVSPCRVCVIGAIGIHKGFQVILDCARDAADRRLPLEFVVVGHTIDDRALLATGHAFITGGYAPDEAVPLIRAQNATLALQASIFPETWCRTLGEAWRAGLRVVAFDIGAQAERIRGTGRGVLLPLGMPPHAINDAVLTVSGVTRRQRL